MPEMSQHYEEHREVGDKATVAGGHEMWHFGGAENTRGRTATSGDTFFENNCEKPLGDDVVLPARFRGRGVGT
jgi:hypothetical protein